MLRKIFIPQFGLIFQRRITRPDQLASNRALRAWKIQKAMIFARNFVVAPFFTKQLPGKFSKQNEAPSKAVYHSWRAGCGESHAKKKERKNGTGSLEDCQKVRMNLHSWIPASCLNVNRVWFRFRRQDRGPHSVFESITEEVGVEIATAIWKRCQNIKYKILPIFYYESHFCLNFFQISYHCYYFSKFWSMRRWNF